MPSSGKSVGWDACVFLSLINGDDDRVPHIAAFMDQAEKGEITIVTSTLSSLEVAFAADEKADGILDEEAERKIMALWSPGSVVRTVDVHPVVVQQARLLVREGLAAGLPGLKAADAIQLATAKLEGVDAFHTYDDKLLAFQDLLEIPIGHPIPDQPSLGFL